MKKLLLAAVAVASIGFASNSFAGGCGTSYVTVQKQHCAPHTTYVYQQPCHKEVIHVPVYQPVIEKKVIVQKPIVTTTYVKPCVQSYKVHTPVYYNYAPTCSYTPAYHYNYSSCGY